MDEKQNGGFNQEAAVLFLRDDQELVTNFGRSAGIGHESLLVVTRLARYPASRFGLLAEHRCGFQFPTESV